MCVNEGVGGGYLFFFVLLCRLFFFFFLGRKFNGFKLLFFSVVTLSCRAFLSSLAPLLKYYKD